MEWPPHLCCVLERQVRNRFSLLSCLKEPEQDLMEEWLLWMKSGSYMIPFLDDLKLYRRLEENQLHIK